MVNVVADLPADAQAAKPVQQCDRALDGPAVDAQAGAVFGAAPGDMRDVLGALRGPDGTQPGTGLSPVMKEVQELVDEASAAGQGVAMVSDGCPEQVPTTHRLAVYRIVEEALTNARKHADGAQVAVRIDCRPPATLVEVTNTAGTGKATLVDSGYGLVGLRERVTSLGGHLDAGPAGAGAWRLTARIPHPACLEQHGTHAGSAP